MNIPVLFALAGSGLNTINDLIYRKTMYESSKNTLTFYAYATFSSALVALIINFLVYGQIGFSIIEIGYGILLGILSFGVYILFLLSFSGGSTVVCVTVYRLNMIPGTFLAIVFLDEYISPKRAIGIILCTFTIILFAIGEKFDSKRGKRAIYLSIGACLLGGILNYLNKLAVSIGGAPLVLIFWRFFTASILATIILIRGKSNNIEVRSIIYSFVSGSALLMAIFFILIALKEGDLSFVIPITQLSFVITSMISSFILKEKTDKFKKLGVVSAVAAVLLML